ncbi:MAG: hypothetical protein KAJ09_15545, partial [Deltaproteobacteria bacterium]|nr:hypothetical protein [Deltaproteobacteria bacterium]
MKSQAFLPTIFCIFGHIHGSPKIPSWIAQLLPRVVFSAPRCRKGLEPSSFDVESFRGRIGFGRYEHYRDAYVKRFGKEPMTA